MSIHRIAMWAAPLLVVGAVALAGPGRQPEPRGAPEAATQQGPTVVILVRHAEKVDDSADPPLSDAGRRRAAALVEVVGGAAVRAIYATQFRRTQETAQPLSEKLDLPITVIEARRDTPRDVAALAAKIRADHPGGGTVLVVGHSNTLPAIIRALGGGEVGEIADTDYDDLFILLVPPNGAEARGGTTPIIRASYAPPF